jgi:hypothetical protein
MRSCAILDFAAVGAEEAIILCPANHSLPTRVAPYPGAPGYEAVATCLASPEARARMEGVIAWRPKWRKAGYRTIRLWLKAAKRILSCHDHQKKIGIAFSCIRFRLMAQCGPNRSNFCRGSTYTPTLYPFGDSIEGWATVALKLAKGDRLVVVGCSVKGLARSSWQLPRPTGLPPSFSSDQGRASARPLRCTPPR